MGSDARRVICGCATCWPRSQRDVIVDTPLLHVGLRLSTASAPELPTPVAAALRDAMRRDLLELLPWILLVPVPAAVVALATA